MSTHPPTLPRAAVSASLHGKLLEQMIPDWLIAASPARQAAMKAVNTRPAHGDHEFPNDQQQALKDRVMAAFVAQTRLDKTMAGLEGIDAFAQALLGKALKDQFNVTVDLDKTLLCLRRPLELGVLEVEVSTFEVLKLPLLQAVLHNFEASECEAGAITPDPVSWWRRRPRASFRQQKSASRSGSF